MSPALWTAREIAAATGGKLTAEFSVNGVSIDTRSIAPGDLFIALSGVRDGNDFVPQALAAGAAGALASRSMDGPVIEVGDTFMALEALGLAARHRAGSARRGAITGSVGKTSVTQAVRAGLELAGRAHSSVKSYNNHIGVPLTLARMPADTERAIFEIGMNHADEITPLVQMVAPHAVLITTVGPVHVENFPDGEAGVARAKAEIFDGLQSGGLAILNADNRWFEFLTQRARAAGAKTASFGSASGADARLVDFTPREGGADLRIEFQGKMLSFPILQSGAHWGVNALAVLSMLSALGVDTETGVEALSTFAPLEGRGAEFRVSVPGGVFTLIDESYNANPVSMAAAMAALGARQTTGRRIIALTDMLELGTEAAVYHAELARPIDAAGLDLVFCAGPLMKSLWDSLPATRRGGYAVQAQDLGPMVLDAAAPGDLVMVKGSNGSRASVVAAAVRAGRSGGTD